MSPKISCLYAPAMALLHPEQDSDHRQSYVQPCNVLGIFAADGIIACCAFRLTSAASQIESLPWVEQADGAPRASESN